MKVKTKIFDGKKYRRSASEYPRSRAYAKAKELRCKGYLAKPELQKNGKFVIWVCKKEDA